jgi:hypothetical protein
MKSKIIHQKSKILFIAAFLQIFLTASLFSQKYENGTRLLKGAEVLSATPLQLDYVLENLADTAKITVNLHEGKTHLILNDGSGTWREWWYHTGKWRVKTITETDPTVPSHVKNITSADIFNWNTTYQWGNHETQGYLTNNTLPVATTSALGSVKVGNGLNVTGEGTLSTTANDVIYGTFKPTIKGGNRTSYTLGNDTYGKYWQNNRMVYMEIHVEITSISAEFPTTTDIWIDIPDALSPVNVGGGEDTLMPAISIKRHSKILISPYTQLGGYLDGNLGVVILTQSNTEDTTNIRHFFPGSMIQFSITYIL